MRRICHQCKPQSLLSKHRLECMLQAAGEQSGRDRESESRDSWDQTNGNSPSIRRSRLSRRKQEGNVNVDVDTELTESCSGRPTGRASTSTAQQRRRFASRGPLLLFVFGRRPWFAFTPSRASLRCDACRGRTVVGARGCSADSRALRCQALAPHEAPRRPPRMPLEDACLTPESLHLPALRP